MEAIIELRQAAESRITAEYPGFNIFVTVAGWLPTQAKFELATNINNRTFHATGNTINQTIGNLLQNISDEINAESTTVDKPTTPAAATTLAVKMMIGSPIPLILFA